MPSVRAIGILRICKMCGVPSVITVRRGATLAGQLIDLFDRAGEGDNFIEPEETYEIITPKTLLIVVDTYQKRLLESQKIYEKCQRLWSLTITAWRWDTLTTRFCSTTSPYASSASELVCELLQFMPSEGNITPLEAEALLAGIMLDNPQLCAARGRAHF